MFLKMPHLISGAPYDAGEDSSRGVIPRKARLAHPRAIVDHQSRDFFVAHLQFSVEI